MEIISRDDFISRTQEPADHGRFAYPHGCTETDRRRMEREYFSRKKDNQTRGQAAGSEYDRLLLAGEVRPPTKTEALIRRANGHPDNASVQACRRLCDKKGIVWSS